MDLICSAIAFTGGASALIHAAYYATLGGAALGWLAIITGAVDLVPIVRDKPALISKVLKHGGVNTLVVIGFSAIAMHGFQHYPEITPDTVFMLSMKAVLVVIMFAGNFIGGSLVLKDRIGTQQ